MSAVLTGDIARVFMVRVLSVLSDVDIRAYIASGRLRIEPLYGDTVRENGVDLRLAREYRVIPATGRLVVYADSMRAEYIVDPRPQSPQTQYVPLERAYKLERAKDYIRVPPNSRVLLTTVERICMPSDLVGFVNLIYNYRQLSMYYYQYFYMLTKH